MNDKSNHLPFSAFGNELKALREANKESIIDVSNAFEMDQNMLEEIESGSIQPSEYVVHMITNHYSVKGMEAQRLWMLAGYHHDVFDDEGAVEIPVFGPAEGEMPNSTNMVFSMNDNRIIYTDMVQVSANQYGVVINFLQGLGPDNKPLTVSRIGMSHAHAESLMKVMTKTINAFHDNPKNKKNDSKDNNSQK